MEKQEPKDPEKLKRLQRTYAYTFYNTEQGKRLLYLVAGIAGAGLAAIWFCFFWEKQNDDKLRQEQEKLQELEEKIKEKDAYILDLKMEAEKEEENTKALITNISHQLKTPLAGLKLMQELCEEAPDETELREYFKRSNESVERLTELTEELMQLSKLENHKIFGRFYRGNRKEVEQQEGAGVGLYLTRKILEEQGGTVSVKASPTGGSIFRVTLPLV